MDNRFPITRKGHSKLVEEIELIQREKLPAIIEEVAVAREHGDLSENAEYSAAREEKNRLEAKLAELKDYNARAEIIDIKSSDDTIHFGATVKIHTTEADTEAEKVYHIAGAYEADISKNIISILAPLARELLGKKPGDYFSLQTKNGSREYEILEVGYQDFDI